MIQRDANNSTIINAIVCGNDDEFVKICTSYLNYLRVKPVTTCSINEICDTCSKFLINLVLIDIEFPQYGAPIVVKYLNLLFPKIKVILLVSKHEIGIFSPLDEANVYVITKPVNLYHLHDTIQRICKDESTA